MKFVCTYTYESKKYVIEIILTDEKNVIVELVSKKDDHTINQNLLTIFEEHKFVTLNERFVCDEHYVMFTWSLSQHEYFIDFVIDIINLFELELNLEKYQKHYNFDYDIEIIKHKNIFTAIISTNHTKEVLNHITDINIYSKLSVQNNIIMIESDLSLLFMINSLLYLRKYDLWCGVNNDFSIQMYTTICNDENGLSYSYKFSLEGNLYCSYIEYDIDTGDNVAFDVIDDYYITSSYNDFCNEHGILWTKDLIKNVEILNTNDKKICMLYRFKDMFKPNEYETIFDKKVMSYSDANKFIIDIIGKLKVRKILWDKFIS